MNLLVVTAVLFVSIVSVECRLVNEATQTDIAFDSSLDDMWVAFKKTHNKYYKSREDFSRRVIWEKNVRKVQQHNLEFDLGKHTYTMGINEYSDLTWDEYRKYLLGARPPKVRKYNSSGIYKRRLRDLPQTVDWRTKGYVTPIKNQGQCGSCWAFSTIGCMEGQHFKKTGQLVSLSEQNLVDCAKGNAGCGGGWMDTAFYYIQTNGGIDTEDSYPYEARDDTCRYRKSTSGAYDYGFLDIARGDEEALQAATAEIGPISVAIDATHESFQQYRSGVYHEPACSNVTTDHAVLVVGYGNYYGQDYWLVKNSWGTTWGDQGFIKMARNKNNNCAIATYASFPMM